MSSRRGRKLKSEDKYEEWTVKKPKPKQMLSHVYILHNTRLFDFGTFVSLLECKGGSTKPSECQRKKTQRRCKFSLSNEKGL